VRVCARLVSTIPRVRLVAFTEYVYRRQDGVLHAERAFALFLAALTSNCERLTIVGRLDPGEGPVHYPLPPEIDFVALPHFANLTRPRSVFASLLRSLRVFWGALDEADAVWLLGPYPHAIAFALLTRIRRRPVVLGVRQDFPAYVRNRRPNRRWMHLAADALEWTWRLLARHSPVIVVGDDLERQYRHAPAVLRIAVSLIRSDDIEEGERAAARSYDGELRLLSVGRVDREKNPLLLAEVLALLRAEDPRWRLIVCGEGPLTDELALRLRELGQAEHAELRGYVPVYGGLLDLYRSSHVFLHVSWTEGLPQVLIEAFASGLPAVATAVGGVPAVADGAALQVRPGDAGAAADAVRRIIADAELRERLIVAGFERARAHTLEHESARVAEFIAAARPRLDGRARRRGG
jgi:glycosyltransferase involved in cell wall biosynthesis